VIRVLPMKTLHFFGFGKCACHHFIFIDQTGEKIALRNASGLTLIQ
jgi:hypothetical protein